MWWKNLTPSEETAIIEKIKATIENLFCHLVTDAGHTEIPPGTETVVGIGPGPRKEIDKITGDLPLLS